MSKLHPALKTFLDFAPIASFLAAYYFFDLIFATGVLMCVTFISLAIIYFLERKVAVAPLVTAVLVGVFGGLTIYTQDPLFIKIKPTIVNLIFAAVLLGGVALGKSLIRYLLEVAMKLEESAWRRLSINWGLFFLFLAIVNEYVWRNFSEAFWVGFKFYGMFTLNIAFWVVHAPYIQKHMIEEEKPQN